MDPLAEKYYHINPYTYVANNPINAIDPDGRDIIHLNGKGTIVGVQNDGKSHITIMDNGKARSLSDYSINRTLTTWNNRNRQVVANIAGHYGNQVGINNVGATYNEGGIAHHDPKDNGIWIAPGADGKVSNLLNDKNNLMNVLVHEQKHIDNHADGVSGSYESHVGVYIHQMEDNSFSETTSEFQDGMVGNMIGYLQGVKNRKLRSELVDQFNNSNKGGYKIDKSFTSGAGWGISKDGKEKVYRNIQKAKSHN